MFQKYYTNTIMSKFIKELLRETYVPTIPIYKLGDNIIKGMTYISNGYIVRAIKDYSISINYKLITPNPTSTADPSIKYYTERDYMQAKDINILLETVPDCVIVRGNPPDGSYTLYTDRPLPESGIYDFIVFQPRPYVFGGWNLTINGTTVTKTINTNINTTFEENIDYYQKIGNSFQLVDPFDLVSGGTYYKKVSNEQSPQDLLDPNYFEIIEPYVIGKFYRGITTNYISNYSSYDADTHKYLGNYLRTYRDITNIDLMPYYNCFSGDYEDNLRLVDSDNGITLKTDRNIEDGYKVMLVPIKFNQPYTIYIDSRVPIKLGAIYYNGEAQLPVFENKIFNPITVSYSSRSKPIYYEVNKTSDNLNLDKDINTLVLNSYLTLLVQVPESSTSNVVILEGNYTPSTFVSIQDNKIKLSITETLVDTSKAIDSWNDICVVEPSLTHTVGNNNYAFSSRLIEYLLNNVITNVDEVSEDIERVQEYCSSIKNLQLNQRQYTAPYTKGVWDNNLRKFIYDMVTQSKYSYIYDINGFVDKDSESIILRGKE